jgi:hypothetical protein
MGKKRPPEPQPPAMTRASLWYERHPPLQELVKKIPLLGGPLDRIFGGLGREWQEARAEHFFRTLDRRMHRVEAVLDPKQLEPSEPLFDLVSSVLTNVIQTRSETKRERFAEIIAKQVTEKAEWEEAEDANRLLADLTDNHVSILSAIERGEANEELTPDDDDGSFEVVECATLGKLQEVFSVVPLHRMSLLCAELVARGLLRDEGMGHWDTGAMEAFTLTESARWFLGWINAPEYVDAKEGQEP